ncbi:ABC transporter ATP-binding protein [Brucella gallinifaecis]|uniref:ABC transporter ATP-binding protein n=1 Tax=Brucella gallinifaecis TaxID=215590 RepID=UPI00235FE2CB|nr:sn-glycerol-3-phosphate ABC transporter ATP-binding protein UgpC [Brucella gallinifaecis]
MSNVEILNIHKHFGDDVILSDLSVNVPAGSFVALVGPSGCGKSTLLRMIAGLEHIDGGEIQIGSRRVNDVPARDRDIAMVFQSYALYPHMTVAQNMAFALKLKKLGSDEIQQRITATAHILGLTEQLKKYPRQLSGGQRQRVAMGRAIVREPKVFLFDEPLSNLDAKLRVQMRSEIKLLHQRLRTTTVYVTHDQIEAMTMADIVVVMNKGKIEQSGPPLTLYDRPENLFVASFIGSPAMNFLSGVFVSDDNGLQVMVAGRNIKISNADTSLHGQNVIVGVRPEHWLVDIETGYEAFIKTIEPTGSETSLSFELSDTHVVATTRRRLDVGPGDRIHVMPDPDKVHLFAPSTGKRLN